MSIGWQRLRTPATILLIAGLAVALLGVTAALLLESDWMAGRAAGWAEERLGREVELGGVEIDWSLHPTVTLEGLRIADAPWATDAAGGEPFAAAEEVRLGVRVGALLLGDLAFREVRLTEPRVRLRREGPERVNWRLGPDPAEPGGSFTLASLPRIDRLVVLRGRLHVDDAVRELSGTVRIDTPGVSEPEARGRGAGGGPPGTRPDTGPDTGLDSGADTGSGVGRGRPERTPIEIEGEGRLGGRSWSLSGRIGSLLELAEGERPYPIELEGEIGPNRLAADGRIERPHELSGIDLSVTGEGPAAGVAGRALGIDLPADDPYRFAAHLSDPSPGEYVFDRLEARIGDDRLSGSLRVERGGEAGAFDLAALELEISAAGPPRDLERLVDIELPAAERFRLDARVSFAEDRWRLREVRLALEGSGDEDLLEGSTTVVRVAEDDYELTAVDARIDLSGADPAFLGRLFGLDLPSLPYALAGHLTREGGSWRMEELEARLDESAVSGSFGVFEDETGDATLTGLDLTGSIVDLSPRFLDRVLDLGLPGFAAYEEPYRVAGHLTYGDEVWEVRELDARVRPDNVPESRLRGSVRLDRSGERPALHARLESPSLVWGSVEELAGGEGGRDSGADSGVEGAGRPVSGSAGTAGGRPPIRRWAEALAPLRRFDADLELGVDRLELPERTLSGVRAAGRLEAGRLAPDRLAADEAGGRIALRGEATIEEPALRGRLAIELEGVDPGRLLHPGGDAAPSSVDGSVDLVFAPEALYVDGGSLHYEAPSTETVLDVELEARGEPPGDPVRLRGTATGRRGGEPVRIDFAAGPLLDLDDPEKPYPVEVDLVSGETRLRIDGTLLQPLALDGELRGMDLRVFSRGPNTAALAPILRASLPDLPPYRVEGRLRLDDGVWRVSDLEGEVGDSDVRGHLRLDLPGGTGGRPMIAGRLSSHRLDLDDLAGLVGAQPGSGDDGTAAPEGQREAREEEGSEGILPEEEYDRSYLARTDADVRYTAERVEAGEAPIRGLVIDATIEDGVMTLDPLELSTGEGGLRARLEVDLGVRPARGGAELELRRLELGRILALTDTVEDAVGTIAGRGSLRFTGRSVDAWAGSANGRIRLLMSSGRIDQLALELLGMDLWESLRASIGEDEVVEIECTYADLAVEDGVARVETLLISTTDSDLVGSGSIDLGEETFDLTLEAHAKDFSPAALGAPVRIGGSFADPTVEVLSAELVARAGATLLAAVAAPAAALVPLIETGAREEDSCARFPEKLEALADRPGAAETR